MTKILVSIMASIFILAQASSAESVRTSLSASERHFLEGKYDVVIAESRSLISSGSGRKDGLYYIKGLSELKSGRFADARTSFGYIISNYPSSKKAFDARLGLGDAYLLEGDTAKALGAYNEMVGRNAKDRNIALVYSRLSSCYAKMGMRDKANLYYDMVKKFAPLSFEAKTPPAFASPVQSASITAPATPRTETSKYSVQVGSFKSKRNADKLAKKLAGRGYHSYAEAPVSSGDKFYRVKVGSLFSKDEASRIASKLKSDGYRIKICTDDACE